MNVFVRRSSRSSSARATVATLFAAATAIAVFGGSILLLNHPWNIQPHLSRLQAINVALDAPPNHPVALGIAWLRTYVLTLYS